MTDDSIGEKGKLFLSPLVLRKKEEKEKMEIRNMYITHHMVDGFSIEVSGYPARRYIGYSQRDAESKYRKEFNLQHKHFEKYVIQH